MKPILEQITLGKERSIVAFKYSETNFETPWHFHPQYELNFIIKSSGTKFIGDYVGSYVPGELVLLQSNLPHCWKNYNQSDKSSESIVIHWNKEIFSRIPELNGLFKMLNDAARGIKFSKKQIKDLKPEIEGLLAVKGFDLYMNLLNLLIKLSSCDYVLLSKATFENNLSSEYESRVSKIHDFIESNYHKKISLLEVSSFVNMSEQSFSRFFSKMMGRPFFTFLNEYRVNIASRMLIDTDWSVAEIGFACGYESLPFFYKKFKKVKNETPIKYRKKHTFSKF